MRDESFSDVSQLPPIMRIKSKQDLAYDFSLIQKCHRKLIELKDELKPVEQTRPDDISTAQETAKSISKTVSELKLAIIDLDKKIEEAKKRAT